MNRTSIIAAAFLASLMPATALAATVASTAIPDGTYTVKVVKVVDAKHVDVVMDNGQEATLPAGRSIRRLLESPTKRSDQAFPHRRQRHGLHRPDEPLSRPIVYRYTRRVRRARAGRLRRRAVDGPTTCERIASARVSFCTEIVLRAEKQLQTALDRHDQTAEAVERAIPAGRSAEPRSPHRHRAVRSRRASVCTHPA